MKERIIKRIIIRCSIIILVGAAVCAGFSVYMSMQTDAMEKQIDEKYANQYDIQTKDLGFLEDEKGAYKGKVIEACEAYDLIGINNIVLINGSVKDNKEKGIYEWSIICDDTKKTAFTCTFKKSTKEFDIERIYSD